MEVYKIPEVFKKWIVVLSIVLLILLSSNTLIADEENDAVYLYNQTNILKVHPGGEIETLPIPEEAQNVLPSTSIFNVALSPDLRSLAFVREESTSNSIRASLQIADLENQTCCVTVESPLGETTEVVNLGGFSPDSTQLIVNFINAYYAPAAGELAVVNVETGLIEHQLNAMDTFNAPAAFFLSWEQTDIALFPICFPCGASLDGEYVTWNPATGDITEAAGYIVASTGDTLEASGDIIRAIQSPDYPIDEEADAMMGPFNVLEYLPGGDTSEVQLVYYDADNLHLISPQWVIDGQAYLIQHPFADGATLVWREGTVQDFAFDETLLFHVAMKDGWLMSTPMQDHLFYFQHQDGEIIMNDLGAFASPLNVLIEPVWGESAVNMEVSPLVDE